MREAMAEQGMELLSGGTALIRPDLMRQIRNAMLSQGKV